MIPVLDSALRVLNNYDGHLQTKNLLRPPNLEYFISWVQRHFLPPPLPLRAVFFSEFGLYSLSRHLFAIRAWFREKATSCYCYPRMGAC